MFIYCEVAVCLISILIKCSLYIYYKRLIKDSDNMADTRTSLLKKLKTSYEQAHLDEKCIDSTNMFVYKFMFGTRMLGMKVSTWESIVILNVLICAVLGGTEAMLSFKQGYDDRYVIMNIMCGFVSGFLIVLSDLATNIQGKIENLNVNVCFYLENELKPSLEKNSMKRYKKPEQVSKHIDEGIVELFRLMNDNRDTIESKGRNMQGKTIKKEADNQKKYRDSSAMGQAGRNEKENEIIKEVLEEYLA